ncbi:tRNA dihydrouridine(16) synthase DusC [Enterovibrio nigricans]|uniref:tRNA-dihydrouridine(16) synthase n=1 Tax=Enterovibrio nigricans DSM 22720 TaxID=1121868 RepID=A0A1T4UD99_9GAMM|nr:tRNA dihydrouridine(16) synthase DusC [Enterovibrio nigricans]PKF50198.1 tRNA dihydrouridine(16) synthase DusC [Enterovibrio nigricans]SKA50586.1 tRNA-dihydrouridine synthase C [Enterovibrio nigricans DSM 22720]
MKLILGPMEGVLDPLMRQILTEINPYDLCVTEFVRVVDAKLPPRVFHKLSPELNNGGKTLSGTPVRVQLLGQAPEYMAENAALATELGSSGIDINFGCPSKTVNGNKGGAALLKEPELIYKVVKAVRDSVSSEHVVSAKVRLGFDDCSPYREIVDAVQSGGANEIVVHGRSKADAYKPGTVRWDLIGDISQRLTIPVTANGDIWSRADALKCAEMTGSDQLMVCRGALNMPNLASHIKDDQVPMSWHQVLVLLVRYSEFEIQGDKGMYYPNRVKQWFRYLQVEYPDARALFSDIRALKNKQQILGIIEDALSRADNV